jgi:hypothetical protein
MSPRQAQRAAATATVKCWRFVVAPMTDKPEYELSLTKFLAAAFAVVDLHIIELTHKVGWIDLLLAITCIATAFGKSVLKAWIDRFNVRATGQITETIGDPAVLARRIPGLGFETPAET